MNFKIRFRRFIAKYFGSVVELIYGIKFKLINFNQPPIIILTPGKVGSSSVYSTLKNETQNQVFHIHNFSEEGIKKSEIDHLTSNRKSKPLHLIVSKILRKKLSNYKGKLLIITIIREPISREISSFFQNTELHKDVLENRKLEIDIDKAQTMLSQELESDICKSLKEWFDLEIYNNFGIDVFSTSFDYEKKYSISQGKNTSHLLLKMEDLDEVFPKAIQEFLNIDQPIHITSTNIGDKKHYANIYKDIKGNIKLKPQKIDQIVNSDYFQQFYAQDQTKILKKWAED